MRDREPGISSGHILLEKSTRKQPQQVPNAFHPPPASASLRGRAACLSGKGVYETTRKLPSGYVKIAIENGNL